MPSFSASPRRPCWAAIAPTLACLLAPQLPRIVKLLLLRLDRSPIRKHVACFAFMFDDFVGELPLVPAER